MKLFFISCMLILGSCSTILQPRIQGIMPENLSQEQTDHLRNLETGVARNFHSWQNYRNELSLISTKCSKSTDTEVHSKLRSEVREDAARADLSFALLTQSIARLELARAEILLSSDREQLEKYRASVAKSEDNVKSVQSRVPDMSNYCR